MVAVENSPSTNGSLPVTLVAGDEASGLANIIGQYVEQLLGDSAEKRREAAALRGRLGLSAREGDVAVTLVFTDEGIAIEEGLVEPDAFIRGDVEFLMHVLAGRANPAWEMLGRTVTIRPGTQQPLFAYRAYRLMRLPGVHVWSGIPRAAIVAGAVVVTGVAVALWYSRRGAPGGNDG